MTKKDYIEKIGNLIINKIKCHAPLKEVGNDDYALLNALNIDVKLPIFIYKKPIDNLFYQAFLNAKKKCSFNLILFEKPKISLKKVNNLKNTYYLPINEMGDSLFNILNKLNINYLVKNDFNLQRREEYLKINNENINFNFIPFYNNKKINNNGIICDIKQFLLNGKNYYIDFVNIRDEINEVEIELNIPLMQGYYTFKKSFDHIEIYNFTSQEKIYFNYLMKNAKVEFSCIDGFESCTFNAVNLKGKVLLKPKQKCCIFFNLGTEQFNLISSKDIKDFFVKSQHEMFNMFDVKVLSKDANFDQFFNHHLPKQIWDSWNDFSSFKDGQSQWLSLRNNIICENDSGVFVSEKNIQLKRVELYRNNAWKKIYVMHGDSNYLYAGRIKYYNFTIITKEIFDKNNEIYLSFAS